MQSGYRKGGESHWLSRIVFTWNADPENGANWKGGLRVLAGSHNTDPLEVASNGTSNHVNRQCHAFAKIVSPCHCLGVCTSLTERGERYTCQLEKNTYKPREEKFP